MAKTLITGYGIPGSGTQSGYFYTCPSTKYAQVTIIQFGQQSTEILHDYNRGILLMYQGSGSYLYNSTTIVSGNFPFSGAVYHGSSTATQTHTTLTTGNILKNGTFIMTPNSFLACSGGVNSGGVVSGWYYNLLIEEVDKTIVEA